MKYHCLKCNYITNHYHKVVLHWFLSFHNMFHDYMHDLNEKR